MIMHTGKPFQNDFDAQRAAEEWCEIPDNEGWTYSGKHTFEGDGMTGNEFTYYF